MPRPRPPHAVVLRFPLANPLVFTLGAAFFRCFVRLRVQGREHLPARGTGGWLLAANHLSHFDPALLSAAVGRWVDWAAMRELYRGPVSTAFWHGLAAFPVDRARPNDRMAARAALERLRAGRVVGIFPEGGIRRGERSVLATGAIAAPSDAAHPSGGLNAGVCRLAVATGTPLVPAAILGSEALYRRGGWLTPGWRRFEVSVTFGPPLRADETVNGNGGDAKADAERMKQRLAAELKRLGRPAAG